MRAGRSRSSRPPEISASADAEPVRALRAMKCKLFMCATLSQIVRYRKRLAIGSLSTSGMAYSPRYSAYIDAARYRGGTNAVNPLTANSSTAPAKRGRSSKGRGSRAGSAALTGDPTKLPKWSEMVLLGLKLPPVLANTITYVLAVVVLHLGIVANPGFFSHDEWQKYDHVHALGITDYIRAYGRVTSGPEFGYPVRPLGFIQQGVSALAMRSSPVIPHLFDVLLHAAIGLLLVSTLRRANADNRMSWLAGVMFAISPLTTFATSWVAASFDQWSTLFWLAAADLTVRVIKDGAKWWALPMMATISSLAILSKENALGMPLVIPIVALAMRDLKFADGANRTRVAMLIAAAALPLLAYLTIRFPAIQNSINGNVGLAYPPSITHIGRNLVDYIAYPFLPRLIESTQVAQVPAFWVAGAFLLHGLLVALVWREFGVTRASIYIFGFLSYILLVLVLPTSSHTICMGVHCRCQSRWLLCGWLR